MNFDSFLAQVTEQSEAMRAAAVTAGPEAAVPTCPEWNVQDLVRHLARVQAWVRVALTVPPDGERPRSPEAPRDWDELLTWWDEQRAGLVADLGAAGPDAPAWTFIPNAGTAGWWARRQAHEVAVHRLDAEHAAAGSAQPTSVPTLVFDPVFAADGADEVLGLVSFVALRKPGSMPEGRVLFHAADAGRAWVVHSAADGTVTVGPTEDSAIDVDANVAGTADAVYRAAWHRPSTAVITGNAELVRAIPVP